MKTLILFAFALMIMLSSAAPTQAAEPSVQDRVRVALALALAQDAKPANLEPATAAWLDRLRASSAGQSAAPAKTPPTQAVTAPVFYGQPIYSGPVYYSR